MDEPRRLVLLGHPVSHSLSPAFQNAALRAAGISLHYEALDVQPDALAAMLASLAADRAIGNVTIPHKEAVAARCARRTPLAERVGAVNTFWHEHGELVGDNSDVGGAEVVMRALAGTALAGGDVALIGAGGSAAAVVVAAERCGVRQVRVYNRSVDRAVQLASRFPSIVVPSDSMASALSGVHLVVNATPIGLEDSSFPVPLDALPPESAVFDLAYTRGETAWVTAARSAGHRAADGEGMLIEQGAISFERWFGLSPDRNAMWKAIH